MSSGDAEQHLAGVRWCVISRAHALVYACSFARGCSLLLQGGQHGGDREASVVLAVHDQQRLGQVRHDVGESPLPDPFEGSFHRVGAHYPGKLPEGRKDGRRMRLPPVLPALAVVPYSAPRGARLDPVLERGAAWRVVAAQADAEQPDPAGIDVRPGLQVVDDRPPWAPRNQAGRERLAGAAVRRSRGCR